MADLQLRRLPVMNRDKRLVGILSLGDLAVTEGGRPAGEALAGISQPRRRALADGWPAPLNASPLCHSRRDMTRFTIASVGSPAARSAERPPARRAKAPSPEPV